MPQPIHTPYADSQAGRQSFRGIPAAEPICALPPLADSYRVYTALSLSLGAASMVSCGSSGAGLLRRLGLLEGDYLVGC